MQLIHALAAGVKGAENGAAYIYNRAGSQSVAYYLGDGGFEALGQVTAGTAVALDENGGASVYVSQLVRVVVKDVDGIEVRTFTAGGYDANIEVRSPSFTGTEYSTGVSAAGNPTTLETVLDLITVSFGATDFNVLVEGETLTLESALSRVSGFLLSVKDTAYGAEGDGTTDDTTAIAAAAAAASTQGKVLFFPKGVYRVTSAMTLPQQIGVLGCGPAHSVIKIDHASASIFSQATSPTDFQCIKGLGFGALQIHAGALFSLTGSSRLRFIDCRFGDSFTRSASALGYFYVAANSISPLLEFVACHIVLADQFAGQFLTDGTFSASHRVQLTGCSIEYYGEINGASTLIEAASVACTGCYFDVNSVTSTDPVLLGSSTGGYISAVGNVVNSSGGGEVTLIQGNGGVNVNESGNSLGSNVSLIANLTAECSLGTRQGKVDYLSHGSTSALDLSDFVPEFEVIHVTVTNNSSFTITCDPTNREGLEFDLILENDAGGASGTFTWNTSSFAGTTSVAGTAPPTSIAAVATVISTRWRCYDGPDGVRFYPIGGSYAGT